MKYVIVLSVVCMLAGCAEFSGGFASGLATGAKLTEDAQIEAMRLIEAVETRREELEIDGTGIEFVGLGSPAIKPETKVAIEKARNLTKDPISWVALLSLLSTGFFGGKAHERRNYE